MRQTALLAALLVFGPAAFAADPQLLNLVMPDAKILAGANGNNIRISPFGQYIIARVGALNLEPQKLIAATGFDPLQDVTEVLAASNANQASPANLLLAEGNFDAQKIAAAVTAQNKNAQIQTLPGATVISITNPNNNKTVAVAFIGNSIAAAGPLADVQAAIARTNTPSAIDPALATQVNQVSSAEDEWLVSSVSVASLLPPAAANNATNSPVNQILPILKSIQSFSGGIKFADNVVMTGQATSTDAQNAGALSAVIKLAVNLLSSMGTGQNAQMAQFAQVLQSLQVTTSGMAVNLSLSVPEAQVEAALNNVLKRPNVAPAVEHLQRRQSNKGN